MVFSQPCSQPPLFTLHSFISERERAHQNYHHRVRFLQHYQASGFFSNAEHSCVTLGLFCEAPSTHYRLTSAVGQSVHGVAFVAETLKTTRGVHTCVITCPLEKTLIYICNQTRPDDIKAAQSVAAFITRDFPPPETRSRFSLNFSTWWNMKRTKCYFVSNNISLW